MMAQTYEKGSIHICCTITAILLVDPRLGILVWYLFNPVYVNGAFDNFFWGFLGWLLLPWTTLMYIAIYPGGILGFGWLRLGMAVFADFATYFGGYYNRERVPYGEQIP